MALPFVHVRETVIIRIFVAYSLETGAFPIETLP
jgi:hypothetical protein